VTTFRQMRLGSWSLRRNFDINADSLAELRYVVSRAAAEGVAAVTLLMHSFSFIGRNGDSTAFWPEPGEARKFEAFLDWVAAREDVEVVTFRELAERLKAEPSLLDGPDFAPTAGVLRTYGRSWARFHTGWKSKAFALGRRGCCGPTGGAGRGSTRAGRARHSRWGCRWRRRAWRHSW